MITNSRYKCDVCGRFISNDDYKAVVWTPFGNTADTEPPEEIHECGKCAIKPVKRDAWITASVIFE